MSSSEHIMRFGICYNIEYIESVHKSPSHYIGQILEQVELLEKLGYDTVWFSEHHCAGYSFGNPAVIAAAAAIRTKRIRIGTGVSLLPLHHPIMLAEQYGLLDVLSSGRLEYGIGRGYLMHEYDWLKIPRAESHERYREAAEFITKVWQSDGSFSFSGKHFGLEGYTYFPKPVQRPTPPIYASAGGTEDSFRWAGEMGFHLGTALFGPNRRQIPDLVALYRRCLVENGHNPATREVMAITQMYCSPDRERAVAEGREYTENYYRFFSLLQGDSFSRAQSEYFTGADVAEMAKRGQVLIGDPESLAEQLSGFREEFGLDFILMEVAQGGAPHDKVCHALETFAAGVIPRVRSYQPRAHASTT
jgi:alkanesulfonate monooxygenase SsuD/methylene tetrahydromethanopterin reductase-like flavin-dependent oxidoreductase (luciferase family)